MIRWVHKFRDSITGLFVRKEYAEAHPDTTEDERRASNRREYDRRVHPEGG